MSIKTLNMLNIILMILSCMVAFVLPFKLFLFSYVVLGPLHYLTEINWLKQRNYFTLNKNDYLILSLLTALFFLGYIAGSFAFEHSILYNAEWKDNRTITLTAHLSHLAVFVAFLCALVMIIFSSAQARILGILAALSIALLFYRAPAYAYFIGFLPTLIHVVLFTAVFILNGSLKSNSSSGLLSFVVFVSCIASFFFIPYSNPDYRITEDVWNKYLSTGIHFINVELISILDPAAGKDIFLSDLGLAVQRMVAFAYTYHYLNWFSKTSLIKWHQVSRRTMTITATLWVASVALYLYSFPAGVLVLLFLSTLHVILEFPLNHKSIIELPGLLKMKKLPSR